MSEGLFAGVDHVAIAAGDPAGLADWYCAVLGFKAVSDNGKERPTRLLAGPGGGMIEMMPDDEAISPAEAASNLILREQIEDVLPKLTQPERDVVKMRFGLEDGYPRTLEEVGCHFKETSERIRQIEAKALKMLRHPTKSRRLYDRGLSHIAIRVSDLEAAIGRLRSHGIEVAEPVPAAGGGRVANFHDPDGNVLQVVERPAGF